MAGRKHPVCWCTHWTPEHVKHVEEETKELINVLIGEPKMTLTKAIEAAREKHRACMDDLVETILADRDNCLTHPEATKYVNEHYIAALPEPMTEAKLEGKIGTAIAFYRNDGDSFFLARLIIQELKAANVLFVKED